MNRWTGLTLPLEVAGESCNRATALFVHGRKALSEWNPVVG